MATNKELLEENRDLLKDLVGTNQVINHNSTATVSELKIMNTTNDVRVKELKKMNMNNERRESRNFKITMALIAIISTVLITLVTS